MRITLVNPPRTDCDRSELAAPLGLLCLGSEARDAGAEVSIVDLNLLYHAQPELKCGSFYEKALAYLLADPSDIYGFTSMAVDSHVALRLAKSIKGAQPNAFIILGGPHFSSISNDTLRYYPWIDAVVEGEGQGAINAAITACRNGERGIRLKADHLLDRSSKLPNPSYDLVNLESYFEVNPRQHFNFEGGRGCRYKCAFCYSPVHYDGPRLFSIDSKLIELRRLVNLGAKHVFFVEDNFLNNTAHSIEFCRELEKEHLNLTWNCYVTFPQLSREVIGYLARAGCNAVFAGIDAVGTTTQRTYAKSFVRCQESLEPRLRECVESGITPTCAFLISPPSHPCGPDIDATLKMALFARNCGAQIRLNTLTLYNGTGVEGKCSVIENDNLKAQLMLDVPSFVEENEYAKVHPHLFPFHSRYTSAKEWSSFIRVAHCLFTLVSAYPMTLECLWNEEGINPRMIAERTLQELGDLLKLDKANRRNAELAFAIPVLEEFARDSFRLRDLLEIESSLLLNAFPEMEMVNA